MLSSRLTCVDLEMNQKDSLKVQRTVTIAKSLGATEKTERKPIECMMRAQCDEMSFWKFFKVLLVKLML